MLLSAHRRETSVSSAAYRPDKRRQARDDSGNANERRLGEDDHIRLHRCRHRSCYILCRKVLFWTRRSRQADGRGLDGISPHQSVRSLVKADLIRAAACRWLRTPPFLPGCRLIAHARLAFARLDQLEAAMRRRLAKNIIFSVRHACAPAPSRELLRQTSPWQASSQPASSSVPRQLHRVSLQRPMIRATS